jgi:hypothetical protein
MDTTRNNIGARLFALLTPARDTRTGGRPTLPAVIERIRQRWRLRLLVDGLLWTLTLSTLLILLSAWLLNAWHFAPPALWLLRLVGVFVLLALVLGFCVKPLRCKTDDVQVALYLEENESDLNSVVLSAVDARRSQRQDLSPQLVDQLVERALDARVFKQRCAGIAATLGQRERSFSLSYRARTRRYRSYPRRRSVD